MSTRSACASRAAPKPSSRSMRAGRAAAHASGRAALAAGKPWHASTTAACAPRTSNARSRRIAAASSTPDSTQTGSTSSIASTPNAAAGSGCAESSAGAASARGITIRGGSTPVPPPLRGSPCRTIRSTSRSGRSRSSPPTNARYLGRLPARAFALASKRRRIAASRSSYAAAQTCGRHAAGAPFDRRRSACSSPSRNDVTHSSDARIAPLSPISPSSSTRDASSRRRKSAPNASASARMERASHDGADSRARAAATRNGTSTTSLNHVAPSCSSRRRLQRFRHSRKASSKNARASGSNR
ncbi:putative polyketide synthase [Burkholderia pseudomallei]|nr:putative polyketide synthase [Burkholderia pseudomallei]